MITCIWSPSLCIWDSCVVFPVVTLEYIYGSIRDIAIGMRSYHLPLATCTIDWLRNRDLLYMFAIYTHNTDLKLSRHIKKYVYIYKPYVYGIWTRNIGLWHACLHLLSPVMFQSMLNHNRCKIIMLKRNGNDNLYFKKYYHHLREDVLYVMI